MIQEEHVSKLSRIIAKCRADEGFKRKLLSDTAVTLKAEGVELPDGPSVRVLENTDKVFHLIIPAEPAGDLGDEDWDKATGGFLGFFLNGPAKQEPKVRGAGGRGRKAGETPLDY